MYQDCTLLWPTIPPRLLRLNENILWEPAVFKEKNGEQSLLVVVATTQRYENVFLAGTVIQRRVAPPQRAEVAQRDSRLFSE